MFFIETQVGDTGPLGLLFIIKIIRFNILEMFIELIIPNNNSVIVKDIFIFRWHLTNH